MRDTVMDMAGKDREDQREIAAEAAVRRLIEDATVQERGKGVFPHWAGSPNTPYFVFREVDRRPYGVKLRWRADEGKGRAVLEGVFIVRLDGEDLLGSDLRELGWRELVAEDRRTMDVGVDLDLGSAERQGIEPRPGVQYVAEIIKDGRRKYPADHYRLVGNLYREERTKGTRDLLQATARRLTELHSSERIPWLPKSAKFPKTTVRNWIAVARKKGFIDDGASS